MIQNYSKLNIEVQNLDANLLSERSFINKLQMYNEFQTNLNYM